MRSTKLDVVFGQGIKWPQICVICGGTATEKSKASCTVTRNPRYYVIALGWTTQTYDVSFPVCHKHKLRCSILDYPSKIGFINSFLFVVFVPTFVWVASVFLVAWLLNLIGLREIIDSISGAIAGWSALFIYGSFFFFFFFSGLFKPVKISITKEDFIKIHIRNKDYMKAFKILNVASIIDD